MIEIKVISQVVEDLADDSQNTNEMELRLNFNYTKSSIFVVQVLGGSNG
jgi:hypothetical protein